MIKIFRQDDISIHIEFDEDGNQHLLEMFNEILKGKNFKLNTEFDMGVIKTIKKGCMKKLNIICQKNSEDESVFTIKKDNVMWKFDPDDIELGIEVFTECSQRGYFSPAEFIRIRTPKNKKLDYIFCKLLHEA